MNAEHQTCHQCGIAPEKNRTLAPGGKYTCPMHPEVISDKPGSCPICGMALELVAPAVTADDHTELDDLTRRFWI
jgi:P-type Cu+ transporter